ncbi:MAG: RNA methyltransferase [Alphaproteobacteria bacterium]|nr:RNA methyltransferase [Alphaproteobacteria bacterium]
MKKVPLASSSGLSPIVILVRPQLAVNIGMVARAMMNCGLSELRLVQPKENHLSPEAISGSSGAAVILEQARVFDSLQSALQDIQYVQATTARVRDMAKRVYVPEKAHALTAKRLTKGQKVAWLFGPERTGLENDDLIMADALVQIPLNPAHSSLNLSQAVLIMGYTWWIRHKKPTEILMTGNSKVANKHELDLFLDSLEHKLERAGYFHFPEKTDRMKRNLRNIFTRSDLTSSEIKTLYSVISYIK